MGIDAGQFKDSLKRWASGVSVVTTRQDGGIRGITVSSFCSLSLDPPLILICIDRQAHSHQTIAHEGCFAVNILRADQRKLSDMAAGRFGDEGARLAGYSHRREVTGAPVLDDCLAWLDCRLKAGHDGGDHTIYVGRIEATGRAEGEPLLYYSGAYGEVQR